MQQLSNSLFNNSTCAQPKYQLTITPGHPSDLLETLPVTGLGALELARECVSSHIGWIQPVACGKLVQGIIEIADFVIDFLAF
jgi:hypothetical protein